jgi:hypothetical protein
MLVWLAILAFVAGHPGVAWDDPVPSGRVSGPDSVASGVTFSATGGSVTPTGLFTAGSAAGAYRVFAAAGPATDTAIVSVAVPPAAKPSRSLAAAAATATVAGGAKIPFGIFNVKPTELTPPFDVAVVAGEPERLVGMLAAAQRSGTKVIVNFAGGKYRNNYGLDGTFSFDVWKSREERFAGLDLAPYIADGTLMANYLIDEPHNPQSWGRVVPYETLEQMAQYSKSVWPGLTTIVRTRVSWLDQAKFKWTYLDAGWSQYSARQGEVSEFRDTEVAAANRSGLALMFSLNILDGGPFVPGCYPGTRPVWCEMTATELSRYGTVLASVPTACGLTFWQYDRDYLGRSDIQASVKDVARVVAEHPPVPCRPRR